MNEAFITGSYAYGTPTESSDLDLAVLVNGEDSQLLWSRGSDGANSCRFGKLNLIVFMRQDRFEEWRRITQELIQQKPVTRDFAIEKFKAAGFGQYGEEGLVPENQTKADGGEGEDGKD